MGEKIYIVVCGIDSMVNEKEFTEVLGKDLVSFRSETYTIDDESLVSVTLELNRLSFDGMLKIIRLYTSGTREVLRNDLNLQMYPNGSSLILKINDHR